MHGGASDASASRADVRASIVDTHDADRSAPLLLIGAAALNVALVFQ
jgi:hypothetical protein